MSKPLPAAPNPTLDALLVRLRPHFDAADILTELSQLLPYESDASTSFHERPLAAVFPQTTEQVQVTVKACHDLDIPFLARGSGTSLSGGSMPIAGGLMIILSKMNRILEIDLDNLRMVVQPGVINLNVSKAVAAQGLYYSPDPSSQLICSIGGNIAFNSGGAHCLKLGMTSNHVLGMKVVLPDGEVVSLGGKSLESPGMDLCGLMVGSEGLLGIVTEATLRLLPKPQIVRTVLAAYDAVDKAGEAVAMVIGSGLLPVAIEIMDRLAIDAAEAAVHAGYPSDAQSLLIVELDGPSDEVLPQFDGLLKLLEQSGAQSLKIPKTEEERLKIWKGRKAAFSAVGRLSPDYLVQDGVVPRGKLGQALRQIGVFAQQYGLRVANVFHAGDGNLHPLVLFDNKVPGELEKAEQLAGDILKMCVDLGGSITGEHGVGVEKLAYMPYQFNERDLDSMYAIYHSFDPKQLSNRGKMLPGQSPDIQTGHATADRQHPLERAGVIQRF
ncbi:MAG: FAD-binding protein [Anaerolineae bacterium]|nr:FAD-binding protein [Anaerolineae bacterium]